MKNIVKLACVVICAAILEPAVLFASGKQEPGAGITVAAAASLKNAFEEKLIPRFEKKYSVKVTGIYDSSGRLQTQIEQGLAADVFMSAARTQMDALVKGGFVESKNIVALLQNTLVLIKKKGTKTPVSDFSKLASAQTIALGDPRTTPAGQYAQEALTKLGVWKDIDNSGKISQGSNVTEVLSWVAAGSAEVGIVYATDAAANKNVEVIAQLPDGLLANPVVYPVGRITKAANPDAADLFIKYLASDEGIAIFKSYGFIPNF